MGDDHLQSINECPDCASQNIVHGLMRDQIICRDCGLIFEPLAPATMTSPRKASKALARKTKKSRKPRAKKSSARKKKRR